MYFKDTPFKQLLMLAPFCSSNEACLSYVVHGTGGILVSRGKATHGAHLIVRFRVITCLVRGIFGGIFGDIFYNPLI